MKVDADERDVVFHLAHKECNSSIAGRGKSTFCVPLITENAKVAPITSDNALWQLFGLTEQ